MNHPSSIRLIGSTNNERGDLFTRIVRDLFFSLGYDNLLLDVATSGREIDIQGTHRFEPRRLVAECKAHAGPIGGSEMNKFLGVLTRERKKHLPKPIAGYFVSLGGFTGSGIQQENDSGDDAVILFDASKVIAELQKGRVLVPLSEALVNAGRCAQIFQISDARVDSVELVCDKIGYLWIIYFSHNKQRTHCAFVHADGTLLAQTLANQIIKADEIDGGMLNTLTYLAPAPSLDIHGKRQQTLDQYRKWLGEECGYIQLDGLPADSDLSATKLKLEKLFVPLKAIYEKSSSVIATEPVDLTDTRSEAFEEVGESVEIEDIEIDEEDIEYSDIDEEPIEIVEPIGQLLERFPHLAVLASPGGGKSTLLKRLSTAYSYPQRKAEIADSLPNRDWLPLYLRCRDLRDRSHRPLLELLHGISAFANMEEEQVGYFRNAVSDALRSGRALLLVDGLDEISDEGSRRVFAQNLRTFVAMFPQTALVVTSRVAGFRDVAGVIAGICQKVTLASLDKNDVHRLCVSWHAEVVADTEKVRREAGELANFIWANRHIRNLVENPLLLTTLLVVKRSNGEIPPTRAALYSEAVRVLVRTWNVEGYAPLDEHETLARLSYVACAMMQRGIQIIGNTALIELLHEAGNEMEAELQFTKVSPADFIRRIEYRSSLLMQTGYQRLDLELQPVFEFRHLTFQEYLAARGFVAEQYPGRNLEAPLVEVLAPHFQDERWQEVIPLAAILAGRKADPVIKRLTAASAAIPPSEKKNHPQSRKAVSVLARCLIEEVTITPASLREALTEIGCKVSWLRPAIEPIIKGKFGESFREVVEEIYFSAGTNWSYYDSSVSDIYGLTYKRTHKYLPDPDGVRELSHTLLNGTREQKIRTAFLLMHLAYEIQNDSDKVAEILRPYAAEFREAFIQILSSGDLPSVQAAIWALAWFGNARVWSDPCPVEILKPLFNYWRDAPNQEIGRKAAWAFSTQQLHPRNFFAAEFWGDCDTWLTTQWEMHRSERAAGVIILGWYKRSPWNDAQLAEKILSQSNRFNKILFTRELLSELGEPGLNILRKMDKRKKIKQD